MTNRYTPFLFKNGAVAKNRVVVPPMASQTADSEGYVTKKTMEHYRRLSQSRAGIIFVEYSHIHPSGKGEPNQLGVDSDDKIYGLQKIAQTIQSSGALAGLQIVHVGGKASGQPLIGASAIPVPIRGHQLETPTPADSGHIEDLISWYVAAAKRAHLAGFDIVELHAAHGYGLNQWLSQITNQRRDDFGGDIAGRSRLLFEVVKKMKQSFPEILLAVRMPGQDYFENGLSQFEMRWVARKLESFGVDLLDISSGIGGWRRPRGIEGQGYLVADASAIKNSVSLPVIGVGGIKEGKFIDHIVRERKVDFAAVGRAILENPMIWMQTQEDENEIVC